MPKLLVSALELAAAAMVYSAANPAPARCAYCTTVPCFDSSQCNSGCTCMSTGPGGGKCVSFD